MREVFAERLQRLRERRQISRRVMSELCGLYHDAIRRYERRESIPNAEELEAIADFLEVSTDYLLGRECNQ